MPKLGPQETVDGPAVYQIVGQPVPQRRPEQLDIAPHPRQRQAPRPGTDQARRCVQIASIGGARWRPPSSALG